MKKIIAEFMATILSCVGFGLALIATFFIIWGALSLLVFFILALLGITRNVIVSAIIGLVLTLWYALKRL